MASRKHSEKDALIALLSECRSSLHLPDTKQIVNQSKGLLQVAGKLPTSMHTRPARSIMIVAGISCLFALILRPKKKKKTSKKLASYPPSKSAPRKLLSFSLSIVQPLLRVWFTEQARRWLRK